MKRCFVFCLFLLFEFSLFAQVQIKKTTNGLLFTEKGDSILLYRNKPVSQNGNFSRLNYIHPLWAPDGTVITEDFPADHLHHRGIFWAWHRIVVNGEQICDGWELKSFSQEILDVEFRSLKDGAGELKTNVDWKSPLLKNAEGENVALIHETTEIVIHPAKKNYRKIDFKISLLTGVDNLMLGGSADEKGYSGFSARVKLPEDVLFEGSGGIVTPRNTAVEAPGYITVSGSMLKDGKHGGIVIIDSPENPGYPHSWILRAKNSMQNVVWPGNQLVKVSTNQPLVLKYSIVVYSGNISEKIIQQVTK